MASGEIRVGDINTRFLITLMDGSSIFDASTTTSLQIIFKKPDGSILTKTASLHTDGTDGKIHYDTILNDLDQVGWWYIQAYVITGSTSKWKSDIGKFKVHENL